MEDEDLVVGGQPQVAFDARADFERGGEGDQAVLGKARAIVQAPVGEALRARIERISARTATIASTSTATPSGRTATPTALRAWRPASPNTSCISSDAPLATLGWSVNVGALVDEHAELHDPLDAVERAERRLHLRQQA